MRMWHPGSDQHLALTSGHMLVVTRERAGTEVPERFIKLAFQRHCLPVEVSFKQSREPEFNLAVAVREAQRREIARAGAAARASACAGNREPQQVDSELAVAPVPDATSTCYQTAQIPHDHATAMQDTQGDAAMLDAARTGGARVVAPGSASANPLDQRIRVSLQDPVVKRVETALLAAPAGLTRTAIRDALNRKVRSALIDAMLELLRANGRANFLTVETGRRGRRAELWRSTQSSEPARPATEMPLSLHPLARQAVRVT